MPSTTPLLTLVLAAALSTAAGAATFDQITPGDGIEKIQFQHLAMNQAEQFVAASTRAVYGGSVPDATASKLYENARVGFRHVRLADDGTLSAVSARNVYRGKL